MSLSYFDRAASVAEQAVGLTGYYALAYREELARAQLAAGRRDAAIATLRLLVDRGYRDVAKPDWARLASDPRFTTLATRVRTDASKP